MAKLKKHSYSPYSVIVDLNQQPDAEAMIKLAKSLKNVTVECKGNNKSVVIIRYPKTESNINLRDKVKTIFDTIESRASHMLTKNQNCNQQENHTSDTRLYNAVILK